jgi:carbohydrate diacid regulator
MITSISRNLAQQIVDTINDVCGHNINFINTKGIIYASNDYSRLDTYHEIGRQVALTGESIEVTSDDQFTGTNKGINIPIYYHKRIIAVVGISGEPAEVRRYAHLAERIALMLLHERELDMVHRTIEEKKQYLMRSLLYSEFDNPEYLEECLRDLNIDESKEYRIVEIEINSRYNLVNKALLEQDVETLFSSVKNGLYIYAYPHEFIGLICNDFFNRDKFLLTTFAQKHAGIVKTSVGKATALYKCRESYRTSKTALDTLRKNNLDFIVFDDLTIEILFSSLPEDVLEDFANKAIGNLDDADRDFLRTYYENDMSLQRTAELLFLHKNTVQQRLNKIMARTKHNPRHFKDAVVLYLALRSNRNNV